MLIRDTGVKLRWLPVAESQESKWLDPTHEVEPAAANRLGNYKLKSEDWNQVKLAATENGVILSVNGVNACRVATASEQKFGVFHEKQRVCEIRNIVLSGRWPQTVPANLLQLK